MVFQVPNTPDPTEIGRSLDTIFTEWPELSENAIAHVFGEHKTQTFGRHTVEYIEPQRVQETSRIKVLIAKDAISTGWDCPRAEVMVSFRPAKARTHITQLMGRMVRTPLARRIPGNDRLNSINCLLPFFDTKSVEAVADALMKGGVDEGDSALTGRRVLVNPIEVKPNPDISEDLWTKLETLSSQTLPKKIAKPIKRLTSLAHELASDNLIDDAGKKAHNLLHEILEKAKSTYADEIKKARESVLVMEGKSLKTNLKDQKKSFDEFVEDADYTVINDAFRRAARGLSPDLAKTYANYLAEKNDDTDSKEEALMEAHTDIAGMGLVTNIQTNLDTAADSIAKQWLYDHKAAINKLSDERKETYRVLRGWSKEPVDIELVKPNSWMVPTTVIENKIESTIPLLEKHIMSNSEKLFPAYLNHWETHVFETESKKEKFVAWYRNPSNASQESLGISYTENKEYAILRPDFIFFSKKDDKSIEANIIDPHGFHLSDALLKLKGMVEYSVAHGDLYTRIWAIAKVGDKFRSLNLKNLDVQTAIKKAENAKSLYEGILANDYK